MTSGRLDDLAEPAQHGEIERFGDQRRVEQLAEAFVRYSSTGLFEFGCRGTAILDHSSWIEINDIQSVVGLGVAQLSAGSFGGAAYQCQGRPGIGQMIPGKRFGC